MFVPCLQVRLTGDSNLAIGVDVSVNGCLSTCLSPTMSTSGWINGVTLGCVYT